MEAQLQDVERQLALAYVPAEHREPVATLWRLDERLRAIVARRGDAMIARIRLAWWREAIERLDREAVPAEPLLRETAAVLLPRGVTGAELAAMEQGWAALLDPPPLDDEVLEEHARYRGAALFALTARLIGVPLPDHGADAGALWALADYARMATDVEPREAARRRAMRFSRPRAWPRQLRGLGALSVLARRDLQRGNRIEPHGSPARVARALWMAFSGR